MHPLTAATLGKAVVTLLCGALVGAVGTVMHRAERPWGLVGALALVLTASVTARAWAGWVTWVGYVGGLFFAVQAMAQTGPGGDLLVPAREPIGWVWVIGSLTLALAVGALPARLFAEPLGTPVASDEDAPTSASDEGAPTPAPGERPDGPGSMPSDEPRYVPPDEPRPVPSHGPRSVPPDEPGR